MRPRRSIQIVAAAFTAVVALATASTPAVAEPTTSTADTAADQIVVKIDKAGGHTLDELLAAFPVTYDGALLESRGIYLLRASEAADLADSSKIAALASQISASPAAVYAEPNYRTTLTGSRYHSWPAGPPSNESDDSSDWVAQPIATTLKLRSAHALSQGVGVRVAVLDTGIDLTHPAMVGRTVAGYDYVNDDADPTDVEGGVDSDSDGGIDDAFGHGTFVAGMVALVAPDARIMPYRVLDSDGVGNVFVVAQAILDAADNRAKVINISFGTDEAMESKTLAEAITYAQSKGAVVVAAAGNEASTAQQFPAADPGVLSVTSVSGGTLSSWANHGGWVKLAAPGDSVVGPLPQGRYATWSGTSMATPVVAGQVALIKSRFPDWTVADQTAAITTSADPLAGAQNGTVDLVASLDHPVAVGNSDDG